MITSPDKMIFRGIKIEFLEKDLDYQSPCYSIIYEHMGFTHQGYYSSNILTICRYLNSLFGMSNNEIFMVLKPVADMIEKACKDIEKLED